MFNFFKKDDRKALVQKIHATKRLMENAMRKHGVNSSQVKDFDKQLDKLEAQLQTQ